MTIAELIEKEKELIKLEYEAKIKELELASDYGAYGDSKWFLERTGIGTMATAKDIILFPFRRELEGKIAYYPETNGQQYRFNKFRMNEWLEKNFERIAWHGNNGR